jgi:6,7-dimethyl-8-ribityllumazine synthase
LELLDGFKWAIHHKKQSAVILVDGRSGMGKTTLSFQIGRYMTPDFSLDNVHFTTECFLEALTMTKVLVIKSTESDVASSVADSLLSQTKSLDAIQFDAIESPTAREIPVIAAMTLESGSYDCIICLGIVTEDKKNPINSQTEFKNISSILSDFSTHYIMPIGSGIAYCENKEDINETATEYFTKAIENTLQLINIKHRISIFEDEQLTPQQKHN